VTLTNDVWPMDIDLSIFKVGRLFFGKWAAPIAKAGFVWLALDWSTAKGGWNRLYVDSNGDGSLKDEAAIKP
jgi:hypothetical protein